MVRAPSAPATADRHPELEALLEYLKRTRGFDFTGYKRASLTRRIDKRRQAVGAATYAAYQAYLEHDPDEVAQLFNTVLINVTSFFRDEDAWAYLRSEIIPRILAGKVPGEPIRVWSAGCATGEEAYSLAMAFLEALPADWPRDRLKIYATDLDEEALAIARAGVYSEKAVQSVPLELLERYFERQEGGRWCFRKEARRLVIFGRNDVIQDAPISRNDLLVCRNTLMYFDAATQARILNRFHFALADEGYLFLGRAETLLSHMTTFAPVDLKRRIFVKVPRAAFRDRLLVASRLTDDDAAPGRPPVRLRDAAFDSQPMAQIVVDRAGTLVLANQRARVLFGVPTGDVGRALQDLELSYRPAELRSRIDQAYEERRPVAVREVEWTAGGESRWYDVHVTPSSARGSSRSARRSASWT